MELQLEFGIRNRFWHGCGSSLLPSMLSLVANVALMLMEFHDDIDCRLTAV